MAGGYDWLAARIFPRVRAQRLLLEYDDERSGGFEPLAHVPDDKMIVLGLVTTKTGRRETVQELTSRIEEASNVVGLERLALPQCGFATSVSETRSRLTTRRRSSARSRRRPRRCGRDGRAHGDGARHRRRRTGCAGTRAGGARAGSPRADARRRTVAEQALAEGRSVYGLTTGWPRASAPP